MLMLKRLITHCCVVLSIAKMKACYTVCNYSAGLWWSCVMHEGHSFTSLWIHNTRVEQLNGPCPNTHTHSCTVTLSYTTPWSTNTYTALSPLLQTHTAQHMRAVLQELHASLHILWHAHTWVGTHSRVHTYTDVELIKRFPEGIQER